MRAFVKTYEVKFDGVRLKTDTKSETFSPQIALNSRNSTFELTAFDLRAVHPLPGGVAEISQEEILKGVGSLEINNRIICLDIKTNKKSEIRIAKSERL